MTDPGGRTPRGLEAPCRSGRRTAIALGSWCLAGVGVLSAFLFAGAGIAGERLSVVAFLSVVPLVAWLSLAVMTVRWVQGRRGHWVWPVLGTACGVVSAAMFIGAFVVYMAAVPLALYLVFWHLWRSTRSDGEDSRKRHQTTH